MKKFEKSMTNREKIHELLSLCMEIQEHGYGENGYPYVGFETSNYGTSIEVRIMDDGFRSGHGYDGIYSFAFDRISERTYSNCKKHLDDLRKKVQECTDTSVNTAERT